MTTSRAQRARWNDPSYISAQARDRLYYVMPGEVSYLVIDDRPPAAKADGCAGQHQTQKTKTDWVGSLFGSFMSAGLSDGDPRPAYRQPRHGPDPTPTPTPDTRQTRQDDMTTPPFEPVTDEDIAIVSAQLGARRATSSASRRAACAAHPTVVATAPRLDDGTPFPTLYYLSHPAATAAMSPLEATQVMNEYNDLLEADDELRAQYAAAHDAYLADRESIAVVRRDRRHLGRRHARARQVPARARRPRARGRPRRQPDRRSRAGTRRLVARGLRVRRLRGRMSRIGRGREPLVVAGSRRRPGPASAPTVAHADQVRDLEYWLNDYGFRRPGRPRRAPASRSP